MKTIISFSKSAIGIILLSIIPTAMFYYGYFKNFDFTKTNINKMELALTTIFFTIIVLFFILRKMIHKTQAIQKYYNIMLINFHDQYISHPCSVFPDDMTLFDKHEKKHILNFLNELDDMKVLMKGKNKVLGKFMS